MYNNSFKYLVFFLFLFAVITRGQNKVDISRLKSNFAKSENKEKYYGNLLKNVERTFSGDPSSNSELWLKALRDAQSINHDSKIVKTGIEKILSLKVDSKLKLQRVALEVAYKLFKDSFKEEIENIYEKTNDDISFAIAVYYLKDKSTTMVYINRIREKFGKEPKSPIINYLIRDLSNPEYSIPDLRELLKHNFEDDKTIVFSFHRKNRIYPGITIIRKPDGEFVKKENGEIFHIAQLALSYSNLPEYLPSGNTPQGIYSIQGTYNSPTETIGPTPNLLTRIPYEVSSSLFYHGSIRNNRWDMEDYRRLLPLSWQNYDPIFNSFYAGKIGRKLIIIHGSTDENSYFSAEPYYPLTPTRGCLSSKEIWDGDTGELINSDQVNLINAFRSTRRTKGYLIVLEIDDREEPVKIEEILKLLE